MLRIDEPKTIRISIRFANVRKNIETELGSGVAPNEKPTYDAKKELERAAKLKRSIVARPLLFWKEPSSPYFANLQEEANLFEMNLIDFCVDNKISLFADDFREQAIVLAARQHPKLNPRRRSKGQPSKQHGTALGGGGSVLKERLNAVESYKLKNPDCKTDKQAVTELVKARHKLFPETTQLASILQNLARQRKIDKK